MILDNLFTIYAGKQTADFKSRKQAYRYKSKLRRQGHRQPIMMVDPDGLRTLFTKRVKEVMSC